MTINIQISILSHHNPTSNPLGNLPTYLPTCSQPRPLHPPIQTYNHPYHLSQPQRIQQQANQLDQPKSEIVESEIQTSTSPTIIYLQYAQACPHIATSSHPPRKAYNQHQHCICYCNAVIPPVRHPSCAIHSDLSVHTCPPALQITSLATTRQGPNAADPSFPKGDARMGKWCCCR
jgi:hypothetical protein